MVRLVKDAKDDEGLCFWMWMALGREPVPGMTREEPETDLFIVIMMSLCVYLVELDVVLRWK